MPKDEKKPTIIPPAPTSPAAPAAEPAPDRFGPLADAVRAMLKALPRDLATAPWPSPAAYMAFVNARADVEKQIG